MKRTPECGARCYDPRHNLCPLSCEREPGHEGAHGYVTPDRGVVECYDKPEYPTCSRGLRGVVYALQSEHAEVYNTFPGHRAEYGFRGSPGAYGAFHAVGESARAGLAPAIIDAMRDGRIAVVNGSVESCTAVDVVALLGDIAREARANRDGESVAEHASGAASLVTRDPPEATGWCVFITRETNSPPYMPGDPRNPPETSFRAAFIAPYPLEAPPAARPVDPSPPRPPRHPTREDAYEPGLLLKSIPRGPSSEFRITLHRIRENPTVRMGEWARTANGWKSIVTRTASMTPDEATQALNDPLREALRGVLEDLSAQHLTVQSVEVASPDR